MTFKYDVSLLPMAAEALSNFAKDINSHGEMIGRVIYPWNPGSMGVWH